MLPALKFLENIGPAMPNRIYFQKDTVPQADRATFELIDYNFGRDRKYVYGYAGEILAGADAKSFQAH